MYAFVRFIPNFITLTRILLVIPIQITLFYKYYSICLLLFSVAALSDLLDGYIARKFSLNSLIGAFLDPLADKLLTISSFISIYLFLQALPFYLVIVSILRDLVIMLGVISQKFISRKITISIVISSKINTALQFLLVVIILSSNSVCVFPFVIIDLLQKLVFFTIIVSFLQYLYIWLQRLQ